MNAAVLDGYVVDSLADVLRALSKRKARMGCEELDDLIAQVAELEQDAGTFRAAAHMLHEQAHGDAPWCACQAEPCRSLALGDEDRGPAPLTLP